MPRIVVALVAPALALSGRVRRHERAQRGRPARLRRQAAAETGAVDRIFALTEEGLTSINAGTEPSIVAALTA
jgi:hypothetical protein